ncbi:MAG TPA: GNAT family N-acetyltransferase [Candidatus Saccharimonadales bacterium]|nr:GNAT family N-acetyltransferase [Candidatus Saccharimonadales bacterium]
MDFPTFFASELGVLDPATLSQAGQEALSLLNEKGYEVRCGLTVNLLDQIKELAVQPSIAEYCPRDAGQRFASEEVAQAWLNKGRSMFVLIKTEDGHLAGYGWSGHETSEHVNDGQTTFALRVSENDQGLGLAQPYSQVIIEATKALFGASHFWLEAWQSNAGAVHIYHKLGFEDVGSEQVQRTRPNGESVDDTRIFMTLPDQNS